MDQLMQMLANQRFEVAVNDRFSGLLVARRLHLEGRVQPLDSIPVPPFLHQRHRDLVPRMETVIRERAANGELKQLRRAGS